MAKKTTEREQPTPTHTKDQLMRSKALAGYHRDVKNAVLKDGQMYTLTEALATLDEFLQRRT